MVRAGNSFEHVVLHGTAGLFGMAAKYQDETATVRYLGFSKVMERESIAF